MNKLLLSFVPVLITMGPIFMIIAATSTSTPSVPFVGGFAGAVGLGAGLASMYRILMRQQKEILRLGQLLAGGHSDE